MERIFVETNFKQKVDDKVIYSNGDIVEVEVANISDYNAYIVTDEHRIEQYQKDKYEYKVYLNQELLKVCDKKQKEAERLLSSFYITEKQLDRYNIKLEFAKNNEDDKLQLEADIKGVSVEDLKTSILTTAQSWIDAIDSIKSIIEAYRVGVKGKIDSDEFEEVNRLINEGDSPIEGDSVESIVANATQKVRELFGLG